MKTRLPDNNFEATLTEICGKIQYRHRSTDRELVTALAVLKYFQSDPLKKAGRSPEAPPKALFADGAYCGPGPAPTKPVIFQPLASFM
jgi:hypothetical protein